ncbi:MAG: hypothetical protein ACK4E7_01735 [Permianibacter sp.]
MAFALATQVFDHSERVFAFRPNIAQGAVRFSLLFGQRRADNAVHQAVAGSGADLDFHAERVLATFLGLTHFRVMLALFVLG